VIQIHNTEGKQTLKQEHSN